MDARSINPRHNIPQPKKRAVPCPQRRENIPTRGHKCEEPKTRAWVSAGELNRGCGIDRRGEICYNQGRKQSARFTADFRKRLRL